MAKESKGTTVKNVMSEKEAEKELSNYMEEISSLMISLGEETSYEKISELVWVSKTGQKIRLKDMETYHILSAIRALTAKETMEVVTGKLPGFSVRALSILALKIELARRYTEYNLRGTTGKERLASWEIQQVIAMTSDIKKRRGSSELPKENL